MQVKDGRLAQAQADEIYNVIKNYQATCDGTGTAGIDRKSGVRFGNASCVGMGIGMVNGMGRGYGMHSFY